MSWWISLQDEQGEVVSVEPFTEGGTYALGGSTEAELNVTYNYGKHFAFRDELDGKKASEVTALMETKIAELGTEQSADYWEASPGNVGHALATLLSWARRYPEAVFRVN
jgi:hypothetical protein